MKGEAAAFLVRAQRCQSHYFSATPRMLPSIPIMNKGTPIGIKFLDIPGRKSNCVKRFRVTGYFLDSRRTR